MKLHFPKWLGRKSPEPAPEQRMLETSSIPITPEQLASVIGYAPTRSGVQIDERSALTCVPVFAAIRVLAESIGMLPTGVYEGDEDSQERAKATDHPAYNMLRWQPNPEMPAAVFKETLQGHLGAWGNAYSWIQMDRAGRPKHLWPLAPDGIMPERVAGQLVYRSLVNGDRFAPEEILHIRGMGYNGLKGYSLIGMAREAIALGKATELFGAGFFGNGASLGGILSSPNKLSPEQQAAIRESWAQMHSGVGNVAKTAVLPGGLKYERVGIPPDEAQFIQVREYQLREVARLYRIPPHMLGDMAKAGYASIEQMSLDFLTYTLGPWLDKWEQELTLKLCGLGEGFYVKFDERRLLRTDLAARKDYYATARQWGWMSANDVRREEGMNPGSDDLNLYLSPANMVTAANAKNIAPGDAKLTPKQSEPGQPPETVSPAEAGRAVRAIRPVFLDAVSRMLRKEANAHARGLSDDKADKFYTEHERHVRQSLAAPMKALWLSLGQDENDAIGISVAVEPALQFAGERHELLPDDVSDMAETKTDEIVRRFIGEAAANEIMPRMATKQMATAN